MTELIKLIIQVDFGPIMLAGFLAIFIGFDNSFHRRVRRFFLSALCVVVSLLVFDSIDYYIQISYSAFCFVRSITTALGYGLRPVVSYIIILVIMTGNLGKSGEIKNYVLLLLPAVINFLLAVVSIWTKWMFSFTAENVFVGGPLRFFPFLVGILYIVIMIAVSMFNFKKIGKSETAVIMFVALSCLAGSMLETIFKLKFLLNAAILNGICAYYIYLHIQLYKLDLLTGAFTRRNFFIDAKAISGRAFVLISFDIDNLKFVNDSKGHAAGDSYILSVTQTVTAVFGKNSTLYRMGGDEFNVIDRGDSLETVSKLIDEISRILKSQGCGASFGYIEVLPGKDINVACTESDAMMYKNKQLYKNSVKQA